MELFVKDVDKSLLKEGMSIPHKYQQELLEGLDIELEFKPVKEYVETKAQDYKDDQVIKETKLQVDEELEKKKVQYENIDRMSKILLERIELIEDMESLLQDMDAQKDSFRDLNEYFNSAQRLNDIIDDENGDIPDNINKAALTQDELYNLLMDSRDTAVHMMENALEILKQK